MAGQISLGDVLAQLLGGVPMALLAGGKDFAAGDIAAESSELRALIGAGNGQAVDAAVKSELAATQKNIREDSGQLDALSCASHSFAPGTAVLMADGTTKPIQDVKVGDEIENAQPGGHDQKHRVDVVHKTLTDTDFTGLTIATPAGPETITGTQNHLYYDLTADRFVNASELKPGDHLQTIGGDTVVRVLGVRNYTSSMVTYDLTIDGLHTYYVVAGGTPVLVHNTSCYDDPPRFWAGSNGTTVDRFPPSRGSTGRTTPGGVNEQVAMETVKWYPDEGYQLSTDMTDPRWPAGEGWVKMAQIVDGVEIHYLYNTVTGSYDDFKFKDWAN